MIHVAKFIARHVFLTTFLALVALALLLSAARLFTPVIMESYADGIAAIASRKLGQPITIEDVSARWHGFGPVLELRNLALWTPDKQSKTLELEQVDVDFDLAEMFSTGYSAPGFITVRGTELTLIRQKDSSLNMRGITAEGTGGDASALLLRPARVRLLDARIQWVDRLRDRPPVVFDGVNVIVRNDLTRHQLEADFTIEEGPVEFRADLTGDASGHLITWEGTAYLNAADLDLRRILTPELPAHYLLSDGQGRLELWAEWSEGRLQNMTGSGTIEHFKLSGGRQSVLDVESLDTLFNWQRTQDGWQLDVEELKLKRAGQDSQTRRVEVVMEDPASTSEHYRVRVDQLNIADLIDVLAVRPPEESLLNDLLMARPQGEILDLDLEIRPRSNGWFRLDADVSGLHMSAWRKLPMLENFSGHIHATPNGGRVAIDTEDAGFHAVHLFRWPIPLKRMQGAIRWERLQDHWRVESQDLDLDTAHLNTHSRVRLDFPTKGGKPFADIQIDFRDGHGAYAPLYYPSLLKPPLIAWLEKGILFGHVPSGSAVIRGPMSDFPFHEKHTGHFEVDFDIEDAIVDLPGGWPDIDQFAGRVRFVNNGLEVASDEGRILDSRIEDLKLNIDRLRRPQSPLVVSGIVRGTLDNTLRTLRETPLKNKFAPVVEGTTGSGDSSVQLTFEMPLKMPRDIQVTGELGFHKAKLDNPKIGLTVDNIEGTMDFSRDGLSADGIKATIDGQPVKVAVATKKENTLIRMNGRMNTALMKKRFPALNAFPLHGKSYWNVDVLVPRLERIRTDSIKLKASSKLSGTEVDLPLGLGKDAGTEQPILVSTAFRGGSLTRIDASLGGLDLEATRVKNGWKTLVQGPTLSGVVQTPRTGSSDPWTIHLNRLVLDIEKLTSGTESKGKEPASPKNMPNLDLKVDEVHIGKALYRDLSARTRSTGNAIRLESLETSSDETTLNMTGGWTAEDGTQTTDLQLAVKTEDLGRTMGDLAGSEAIIGGTGSMDANLTWSGPPTQLKRDSLSGEIHFDAREGRFSEVDPGVGRLLGLLNITALQRRLKLDFSDFFTEGFVFDKFSGEFTLSNGVARTDRTEIKAPSAKVRFEGFTNLNTGILDQNVYVEPALGTVMAIAGGLTGGPVVGAALLAAGSNIDRIATTQYHMTGPWKEPKVERVSALPEETTEAEETTGLPEIH